MAQPPFAPPPWPPLPPIPPAPDDAQRAPAPPPPPITGAGAGLDAALRAETAKVFQAARAALGQGQIDEARAICDTWLGRYPDSPSVLNLRGWLHYQADELEAAETTIRRALRNAPTHTAALNNLGLVLTARERLAEAEAVYRQAIAQRPDHARALSNLGALLVRQDRAEEALPLHRQAVAAASTYETQLNLGSALLKLERFEEAAEAFHAAEAIDPTRADAPGNLGRALLAMGDGPGAVAALRTALERDPDRSDERTVLSQALLETGDVAGALAEARAAAASDPDAPEGQNVLGNALLADDRPQAALAAFDHALIHHPDSPEIYCNRAGALKALGRVEAALEDYREALRLRPGWADAEAFESLALLALGRYREGWAKYERRWEHRDFREHAWMRPRWDGTPAPEATLLIAFEQGYGDAIQAARFLPAIRERVGRVILCVPPILYDLFQGMVGVDRLIQHPDEARWDMALGMMSMPYVLGIEPEDLPAGPTPYLRAPPMRRAAWRDWVAEASPAPERPRIGLCWSGRPTFRGDRPRSFHLDTFAPLAEVAELSFHALQVGPRAREAKTPPAGMAIQDWSARLTDFAATAALIEELDLVISSDTVVPHLAAALGKPVWVLLHSHPDWRWELAPETTPWYPTMRLFRQRTPGDWGAVVQQVRAALIDWRDTFTPNRDVAHGEVAHDDAALTEDASSSGASAATDGSPPPDPAWNRWAAPVEPTGSATSGPGPVPVAVAWHGRVGLGDPVGEGQSVGASEGIGGLPTGASREETIAWVRDAFDQARAALDTGRLSEAAAICDRALHEVPQAPRLLNLRGWIAHRRGHQEEAERRLRRAVALTPRYAAARNNLGLVLANRDRPEEAVAEYREALSIRSDYPEALSNLGGALTTLGRYDEAEAVHRRAVDLAPGQETLINLGNTVKELGRIGEALTLYRVALYLPRTLLDEHEPDATGPLLGAGEGALIRGRAAEATGIYLKHLRGAGTGKSKDAAALRNQCGLALALLAAGRMAEAEAASGAALAIHGADPLALYVRALYLLQDRRAEEALPLLEPALAWRASWAEARFARGWARRLTGALEPAEADWRFALLDDPHCVEAAFNISLALLQQGDSEGGWPLYDARYLLPEDQARQQLRPRWGGEPLGRGTLYVAHEQGVGDTLMAARFLPLAREWVERLVLRAPASVAPLLAHAPGVDEVIAESEPFAPGPGDRLIGMMSLPGLFAHHPGDIPDTAPYLAPPAKRSAPWRKRMEAGWVNVGLVWSGNPTFKNDRARSFPLETYAPLAGMPGVVFHALQVGHRAAEAKTPPAGMDLRDWGERLSDYGETAAALRALDLLITSDTSVAHLAGALGVRCWVCLHHMPDWRWSAALQARVEDWRAEAAAAETYQADAEILEDLDPTDGAEAEAGEGWQGDESPHADGHGAGAGVARAGADPEGETTAPDDEDDCYAPGRPTPWYPTLRLFQQERQGDWAGVMAQVAEALRAFVRACDPEAYAKGPSVPAAKPASPEAEASGAMPTTSSGLIGRPGAGAGGAGGDGVAVVGGARGGDGVAVRGDGLRLNLGCGFNKRPGWINVDYSAACEPDRVVDLERTPWPWPENAATEVLLVHVLEHLGASGGSFLRIMAELYRVCRHGARILIRVPHPRHDDFLGDPTHVTAVTLPMLRLFDQTWNRRWNEMGASNSALGLQLGVDLEVSAFQNRVDPRYREAYPDRDREALNRDALFLNNVIKESQFELRVHKPARSGIAPSGAQRPAPAGKPKDEKTPPDEASSALPNQPDAPDAPDAPDSIDAPNAPASDSP